MSSNEMHRDSLDSIISRLRQRQRLVNIARGSAHGLFLGAVAALGIGLAGGIIGAAWFDHSPWMALLAIPIGALLGVIAGSMMPLDDLRLARALDRAASSEDRFASALQLSHHHRHDRAKLIAADALALVGHTPAKSALPVRMPKTIKWTPLPLVALACLLWLMPSGKTEAAAPLAPEIDADEWAELHDEFNRELQDLPQPETAEEQEMRKQLEELADLLKQKPEKKDALKEIAKLQERLDQQRKSLGNRDVSMKNAAKAMAKSQTLKQIASMLKQGQYTQASAAMQDVAQQMKDNTLSPDATEFEAIAADMEKLAQEMANQEEMQQACQNCANAASSMNRQQLSEALKRLAEQLKNNSKNMKQCDSMSKCQSLLDQLKRRMNQCSQCKGCKNGCAGCQGGMCQGNGSGANKGGFKPGWGSAAKWDGGSLAKGEDQRTPDVADTFERQGENSSFKIVSPDERADSAQSYEELYAEFVQKAEADLDLETVPVAYREYLRRYFNSIRPQETAEPESE